MCKQRGSAVSAKAAQPFWQGNIGVDRQELFLNPVGPNARSAQRQGKAGQLPLMRRQRGEVAILARAKR